MTKTRKNGSLKNRAKRWLRFSQSLIPVQKLREVIVIHPVTEKNLSRVFKIPSGLPKITLGKHVVKTGENIFFVILGKVVLEEGEWFSDPPWGGKCY
jgi:hypothetical protein